MTKTIVVAIDGSETGFKAVDIASDLADHEDDNLVVLNVVRMHHPPQELQRYFDTEYSEEPTEWEYDRLIASGVLKDGKLRAEHNGVKEVKTQVEVGEPAKMIVSAAKKYNADIIVMGTRGLGKVKGFAFGSVSQKVNHLADCTVITVS